MLFFKKERQLSELFLCGNPLPWVSEGIHLGNHMSNKYDGMKSDIKIKRGQYISKNCELQQEFYFAHPNTKFDINQIYNSHFTGSPLWNLFSWEAEMVYNSWNVSFRHIYALPIQTHRYFIEPISGKVHIKTILMKRFLGFLDLIRKCPKSTLRSFLSVIEKDTRSVTGMNLRNILLLTDKCRIEDLTVQDIQSIPYHPITQEDIWRVPLVQEITDIRNGLCEASNFSGVELDEILKYCCTN